VEWTGKWGGDFACVDLNIKPDNDRGSKGIKQRCRMMDGVNVGAARVENEVHVYVKNGNLSISPRSFER